jgi:hypothetical protein
MWFPFFPRVVSEIYKDFFSKTAKNVNNKSDLMNF